jgi:hypothetical protein
LGTTPSDAVVIGHAQDQAFFAFEAEGGGADVHVHKDMVQCNSDSSKSSCKRRSRLQQKVKESGA